MFPALRSPSSTIVVGVYICARVTLSVSLSMKVLCLSVLRFGGKYIEHIMNICSHVFTLAQIHSSSSSSRSCNRLIGNVDRAYNAVPPPCLFLCLVKGA